MVIAEKEIIEKQIVAPDSVSAQPYLTTLSNRDFDHLMELLEADAEPNETLRAASEEYKRRLADGSLQVED